MVSMMKAEVSPFLLIFTWPLMVEVESAIVRMNDCMSVPLMSRSSTTIAVFEVLSLNSPAPGSVIIVDESKSNSKLAPPKFPSGPVGPVSPVSP